MQELSTLRIEEYKSLRSEIDRLNTDARTLEVSFTVGLAVFYGWLLTRVSTFPNAVWYLPSVLAVLGGLRSLAILQHMMLIAQHLRHIEAEAFATEKTSGWETVLAAERRRITNRTIGWSSAAFWLLLLGLSLYVALAHRGWALPAAEAAPRPAATSTR